jgi:hypothetical protein
MYAIGFSFPEMIRHYRDKKHEMLFVNLAQFDTWRNDRKLLVYYEDLMTNPQATIAKVVKFIKEPLSKVKDFIASLDFHKERCLTYYRARHGSITEGKDLTYHTDHLSKDEVQILYHHIKATNPSLWNKYLSRYDKIYDKDICTKE